MNNDARSIFVANLKKYMQATNKSQTEISRALKVPLSTVSSWYNAASYPRVDKMQALADYFGVSMRDLTDIGSSEEIDTPQDFETAEEAVNYLMRLPVLAAYGGTAVSDMTDEEKIRFAKKVVKMIKTLSEDD